MKKITLFLPSLANGGAERVMLNIANGLVELPDIEVDLLLVKAEGPYLEQVADRIRVVDLDKNRIIASLPSVIRYLKAEQPHAVLSALDTANVIIIWAAKLARSSARIVVSEHCNFSSALDGARNVRAKLLPLLVRLFYPMADTIVAVSKGVADNLHDATGVPRSRIAVCFNPVITSDLELKARQRPDHNWFASGCSPVVLGIGRLMYQKNFELLIRAFSRAIQKTPARLLILGEGDERQNLEKLIVSLKLQDKVCLHGFVQNPYSFLSHADVFVLSSRYEGLPTVLIEALYCGVAVISTNCPDGPDEILEGGLHGKLIPPDDERALADAIVSTLRGDHPKSARKMLDRYQNQVVIEQYRDLLLG